MPGGVYYGRDERSEFGDYAGYLLPFVSLPSFATLLCKQIEVFKNQALESNAKITVDMHTKHYMLQAWSANARRLSPKARSSHT